MSFKHHMIYSSTKDEKHLVIDGSKKESIIKDKREIYRAVLGWNFTTDEIELLNDSKKISSQSIFQLGGGNSFNTR